MKEKGTGKSEVLLHGLTRLKATYGGAKGIADRVDKSVATVYAWSKTGKRGRHPTTKDLTQLAILDMPLTGKDNKESLVWWLEAAGFQFNDNDLQQILDSQLPDHQAENLSKLTLNITEDIQHFNNQMPDTPEHLLHWAVSCRSSQRAAEIERLAWLNNNPYGNIFFFWSCSTKESIKRLKQDYLIKFIHSLLIDKKSDSLYPRTVRGYLNVDQEHEEGSIRDVVGEVKNKMGLSEECFDIFPNQTPTLTPSKTDFWVYTAPGEQLVHGVTPVTTLLQYIQFSMAKEEKIRNGTIGKEYWLWSYTVTHPSEEDRVRILESLGLSFDHEVGMWETKTSTHIH